MLRLSAAAAALPCLPEAAAAQTYPTRPVRIVVPYPVGIAPDIATRLLAQGLSQADSILAAVLFALVATSVIGGMEIFALVDPDRARDRLGALRGWLDRHRDRAIVILSLVIGIYLIVRGASEIW